MSEKATTMRDSAPRMLRALVRTFTPTDRVLAVIYVVLALASALAGSVAAVLLVPLLQPGHTLPFGGHFLNAPASIERHAAIFLGATAVFALMRWQATTLGARLFGRCGMRLRRMVHARLVDAPLVALADTSSAEIANVLTYNVEIILQGLTALQQLMVAGSTAAISLCLAFWLAPGLVLAAPILAGFAFIASRAFGREQSQVGRQCVADMTQLFWHSEDFTRRLRHVRSFEREDAEKASYADVSARLNRGYCRQQELLASGRLLLESLAAVAMAGLFVLAHHWQGIDQVSLIAVCLLLGRLLPYLVSTRQSFQQLRTAAPAFELWQRYMQLDTVQAATTRSSVATGENVLHIEKMRITPPIPGLEVNELVLVLGELTLVYGDSGIGKSSLVDVLAGMMAPECFEARAGGQTMGFNAYRERVRHGAYISQSVRPWQHTVRECLLWAAPEASDDMLQSALIDVGLDKRLATSIHGLDTSLQSSSSRLSGGELQRLMLAQVILRRPALALLDEATSALDAASEIMVLQTIKRRLPATVLIVVSHRPGVEAIADQTLTIGDDRRVTVHSRVDPRRPTPLFGSRNRR